MIALPWWLFPLFLDLIAGAFCVWLAKQELVPAAELASVCLFVVCVLVTLPIWCVSFTYYLLS